MSMKNSSRLKKKIEGSVYGFAIGDAMGATTEFMSKENILKVYGEVNDIIGGGWLNLIAGSVTDDTQMTMCVMDALEDCHKNYYMNEECFQNICAINFIHWLESKPIDVGGQCKLSISKGMTPYFNGDYMSNVVKVMNEAAHNDKALGNGSLMRAMPCALINRPDLNVAQGALTHDNKTCNSVILEYTSLLQHFLCDKNYNEETKKILEPSGCIINTFNNAKYWSQKDSFYDSIIGAVNDGGDADTIAAITGSLAGARFGIDCIPKEWIEKLNPKVKKSLNNFIKFVINYLQI